jgi:branched-chain amino acid transport system permease protein
VSTFLTWQLFQWGVPLFPSMLIAIVGSFLIGALLHRTLIQPLGNAQENPLAAVIITIGLLLGLNALCQKIWGSGDNAFPALFGNGSVTIFGAAVTEQRLGSLAVLAVVGIIFYVLFQRTRLGLFMRASASNPESAALAGVPVSRMLALGWGLAAAVGTIAGTFAAPYRSIGISLMLLPIVYSFAAITVGGFDSFIGAIVGGLLIGVVSDVVPRYVGFTQSMPLFPPFVLVLIVLLLRPQGLFGTKRVVRV